MDALTAYAPLATPAPEGPKAGASAQEAADQFEGYLVTFLASEMRKTVKDGPFSEGAVAMFADLFDQEIGRRVAEGPGLGLDRTILPAIERASKSAAQAVGHAAGSLGDAGSLEGIAHGRVTSRFGARVDPFEGTTRQHDGVDIAASEGAPVRAARAGVVRYAGDRGSYGNVVIVDHGEGLETRYAHCASVTVRAGDLVSAGEQVASVGSTGRSTGAHLHFEVRKDGIAVDPEGGQHGR